MRSAWYILGRKWRRLNRNSPPTAARNIASASATDSKRCTWFLRAYGIGHGDEVIVPSNTYIATWLAVSYAGATPVPVEPDEELSTSTRRASQRPSRRAPKPSCRCIFTASRRTWTPIMAIAKRHRLKVIEDNAQAQGARYKGRRTGVARRRGRQQFLSRQKSRRALATPAR